MNSVFKKYVLSLMAYGFSRKVIIMQDACVDKAVYEEETKKLEWKQTPLLFVEKGAVVLLSTLLTPVIYPIYMYNDFQSIEKTMRGLYKNEDDKCTIRWHRRMDAMDFLFV